MMYGGKPVVLTLCNSCRLALSRQASSCPFTGNTSRTIDKTSRTFEKVRNAAHLQTLSVPDSVVTDTTHGVTNHHIPQDIPGPTSFPIIGTLYKYLPYIGSYSLSDQMGSDRARYQEFGPIVKEKIFPGFTVYHIYDLDLVKEVYHQERMFPNRFALPGLEAYRELRKTTRGLSLMSGKEWRDHRRSASDLMRPEYIANFFSDQVQIASDFSKLVEMSTDSQGEVPNMISLCYRYALESTGNMLFAKRIGTLSPDAESEVDVGKLISAVLMAMDALCKTTYFWPIHKTKLTSVWKNLCTSIDYIAEVTKTFSRQMLEELEEGSPDDGKISYLKTILSKEGISESDAIALVSDVIFAGVESTGLVMLYNMYNLARFPDKQQKLYEEVMTHAPPGEPITAASIEKMKYLKAVMKETFRITPLGVGNARILQKDLRYKSYTFPKESLMLLNTTMAAEAVPDNTQFLPERWLGSAKNDLHPYLILPFGLGARSCLGRRLAMMEMQIALIKIVQDIKLEYHHEDVGFVTRFGNVPDRPVRLSITRRHQEEHV